ncbi:MAG: hypothetical protein SO361_05890 [Lachnospira sp.]|nr:hypothetical protein [Lachnospira sp.]
MPKGNFIPHVRMMDCDYSSVDIARQFGLPYVVLRKVRPYDTTTLNYNWKIWETLYAPVDGNVFFMHNEPLTYADTAVIKLCKL